MFQESQSVSLCIKLSSPKHIKPFLKDFVLLECVVRKIDIV